MKKYIRKPDYASNDVEKIKATESVDVNPETYDDSNDPDDTYYSFDSIDEFWRWVNDEKD